MEHVIRKMSISRRIWIGFTIALLFPIAATILTLTNNSEQGLTPAGTLLIVGILVGFFIAWLISRSVSNPIARTIETVTGIANGDIALNECLAEQHGDEVGELACVFNVFSGKVAELVSEVAKSSGEVISAVAKTSENANRITRLVDSQDIETEQVATAMNEMSATVAEVSRNACQADEATTSAGEEAATGLNIVTKTASSIQELSSEVKAAGEVISQVARDTEQIGSVLDVIKSIAEQTNLLALNAAIEAARAGEQGRGFAVVADEVRNLANRTQESTVEIEQMIVRLQEGAHQAVSAMESGREKAELNVDQANQARDTLQKITAAVSTISDMNTQIATASEQQSNVAEEINSSIATINDGSTEVAQNFRSTLAITDNLAELAGNLQRIVANFKLGSSPSIDFEVAKSAHLAWRARLRSFLDGQESLSHNEAVSHHDCVLGKWYYSEGLSRYGHLADMRELEKPHAELHGIIKNIVTLKEEGRHNDAENEYAKVETLSATIIGLLNRVEQQVETA